MPPALARFAEGGAAFTAILIAAIVVLALLVWFLRRRNTPDERERRRRLRVHRQGRLVSGVVMDIDEPEPAEGEQPRRLVHYNYRIGAVDYSACQDVTALDALMAVDPAHIVGAVQVKVHQKNPYNSIVVCEEWSGFEAGPLPRSPEGYNRGLMAEHLVHCVKLGKELPGLDEVPFDHPLGQRVYDNVSKQAWAGWIEHLKMIINEFRLNPATMEAQEMILQQMEAYFFGQGAAPPPDYKPQ